MSDPAFVHLHVHSQYSILDGVSHFDALFEQVKALGMDSVALTDHGNLFGAYAFYKEAQKAGVRPIVGCEVYVSPTDHRDRTSADSKHQQHLVLLSQDFEGYLNLCHLVSKGFLDGFYYKPRIDKELLAAHSKGLIGLSACLSGVVAHYLRDDRLLPAQALQAADDYAQILGPDNFYLELMDHGLPEQKKVNQHLLAIARKTGLPLVATNDAHYIRQTDAKTQDLLIAIGTGKTLEEKGRFRFDNDEFYLKSPREMADLFGHIDGAIENTVRIAERCRSEIRKQSVLPVYTPPTGQTPDAYLRDLVEAGLRRRYPEITPAVRERCEYEMKVIADMGFVSYFLVVWDFVHFAHAQGIPSGCRGSGAGSIVAYTLDITELDPIRYKLFFERFLNPERVSMPDFDIDLCKIRRPEVIEYVRGKYGPEKVSHIITFGTLKAKAAVRDVGRVKGITLSTVDRVAKMIPEDPKMTMKKALEDAPDLKNAYNDDPQVTELIDLAKTIEGAVRQPGMHAAGVVVCSIPLIDALPLYRQAGKEETITQYNMNEVEELGFLKIDFLGLNYLSIIEDCIQLIRELHGIKIDWEEIGLEDPDTYALLQRGDGFGVFQVESSGMRDMLQRALPSSLEDITALIALYRPGPMQFLGSFIDRKHGREPVTYPHPDMEEPLRETYGLMVYQEQVMQVASLLGGFSLGQADLLRRAMSKKKEKEMAKSRLEFLAGAQAKGIDPQVAEEVFAMIEKFAAYGFNKAHAVSYALHTYRTAYLKAHYPAEYMASLLTGEVRTGSNDKLGIYVGVAREMGLAVLQPDINLSQSFFSVVEGEIRFGLAAIKNVGQGPVEHILAERKRNGPFQSFQDFCERIDQTHVNSRAIECLITAGAFDGMEGTRPQLLAITSAALEMGSSAKQMKDSGQTSLFDILDGADPASSLNVLQLPRIPDWTDREKFAREKELAGIFLSGHPLDRFIPDIRSFATCNSMELQERADQTPAALIGMITSLRQITTQKGDPMAFVELEDLEGKFEAVFFPRTFEECRALLVPDAMLSVEGKVSKRETDKSAKILVDRAQGVEDLRRSRARFVDIPLPAASLSLPLLERIRSLLRAHHGTLPVRFRVQWDATLEVYVQAHSRFKINPSDAFLRDLEQLDLPRTLRFSTQ